MMLKLKKVEGGKISQEFPTFLVLEENHILLNIIDWILIDMI